MLTLRPFSLLRQFRQALRVPKISETAFKNFSGFTSSKYLNLRFSKNNYNQLQLLSTSTISFWNSAQPDCSHTRSISFWNSYILSCRGQGAKGKTYISTNLCELDISIRRHKSKSTDIVKSASSEGLNMANYVVGHDKKKTYFYIKLTEATDSKAESMAILQYKWVRPGLVDLHHTEVPMEFQGQGIAKHLVLAALDSLCEENIFIRPTCTYVQKVLKDNPNSLHTNHIEKGFTF